MNPSECFYLKKIVAVIFRKDQLVKSPISKQIAVL